MPILLCCTLESSCATCFVTVAACRCSAHGGILSPSSIRHPRKPNTRAFICRRRFEPPARTRIEPPDRIAGCVVCLAARCTMFRRLAKRGLRDSSLDRAPRKRDRPRYRTSRRRRRARRRVEKSVNATVVFVVCLGQDGRGTDGLPQKRCPGPSKLDPTPHGNELARTPRYVAEHGGQIFGKPQLPHPRAAYRLGGTRKQKILKFQGRDI